MQQTRIKTIPLSIFCKLQSTSTSHLSTSITFSNLVSKFPSLSTHINPSIQQFNNKICIVSHNEALSLATQLFVHCPQWFSHVGYFHSLQQHKFLLLIIQPVPTYVD